jgi:hypothetical protein
MASYTIKSNSTTKFTLTADDKELGALQYEKWFSFKAVITLANYSSYSVEPKGFWGTTIELKQSEKVLLKFKMDWKGNIILQTYFDNTERDFLFKQKDFFKGSYVLLDKEERKLLLMQPDFKWNRLNYDYQVSSTEEFEAFPFKDIMLLAVVHCANYYMSMMTTVIAT